MNNSYNRLIIQMLTLFISVSILYFKGIPNAMQMISIYHKIHNVTCYFFFLPYIRILNYLHNTNKVKQDKMQIKILCKQLFSEGLTN